jgi:hypothetical protein
MSATEKSGDATGHATWLDEYDGDAVVFGIVDDSGTVYYVAESPTDALKLHMHATDADHRQRFQVVYMAPDAVVKARFEYVSDMRDYPEHWKRSRASAAVDDGDEPYVLRASAAEWAYHYADVAPTAIKRN